MNALMRREAKWNIALAGPGRLKARDRCGDDGSDLSSAILRREHLGGSKFDGHLGNRHGETLLSRRLCNDTFGRRTVERALFPIEYTARPLQGIADFSGELGKQGAAPW